MKRKKKKQKKSIIKALLGRIKIKADAMAQQAWNYRLTIGMLWLIVRVECLHLKLDQVCDFVLSIGEAVLMHSMLMQARVESAVWAIWTLMGGEAS